MSSRSSRSFESQRNSSKTVETQGDPAHVASSLSSCAIEFSSGWHVNQSRGEVQSPFKNPMDGEGWPLIEEPLIDRESYY